MTRTPTVRHARAYYEAIDSDDYARLGSLLAEDFVHDRPDRQITGRDRFVTFMRDERPQTDTSHPLDGVYGTIREQDAEGVDVEEVLVRGRLLDAAGELIVRFVDVFTVADGDIERIETYTR